MQIHVSRVASNHVHLRQATTRLKSTRASFSNAKNDVIALEVNQEAVQPGEILQA